jgi:hypothetical protein
MRADFGSIAVMSALAAGCAVDLDPSHDGAPEEEPARELRACRLLPMLDSLTGRVTPVVLSNGEKLLLGSAPEFDGSTASAAFAMPGGKCADEAQPLPARPIVDVTMHASRFVGAPRAGVTTDAAYLYFSLEAADGSSSEGGGIARFDEDAGTFVSLGLLWTSDRPSYGSAALVEGDYVYAYGGQNARFLSADVYVARAPLAKLAEPAAYEYFLGGGNWGSDPDLAAPIVEGGAMPSVVWRADLRRYLMAYTTPLAREITIRSGLGPSGPWSAPHSFGACALPFPEAFCVEVVILPELARGAELALAQPVVSLEPPASARPSDYWTQLVRGPLPSSLP